MSNIQKWGTYAIEEAQAEADELDRGSGSPFFTPKAGKNVVRFLPPPIGKSSPFKLVWQHGVNVSGGFVSFPCPLREHKQPCPACQKAEQYKASGNPADYERAKALFAKRRIFANIIDRSEPEKGVQVFGFGRKVHEALVALRTDIDAGGDFTHPETGFDIIIERKGTGKNDTEYKTFASRKQTPLGDLNWLDQQVSLDQFAKLMSPEEIRAKVSGNNQQQAAQQPAPQPRERLVEGQRSAPSAARAAPVRTVEDDLGGSEVQPGNEDVPF